MIEESKDMVSILDYSLLKSNQLFMAWFQRLRQQVIQFSFQMISGMVGVIIINRRKLFFKSLRLQQHNPEPNRPGYFIPLFKVLGFAFQMRRTQLMFIYRCLKMCFPAIMNKYSLLRNSAHIIINRSSSPVGRSSNESGKLVLPCPEPILFPIDFHSSFVSTNNLGIHYTLPDHFIRISTLECQPVQQIMQSSFTNWSCKQIMQHFLKPFKWHILSDAQITDKGFDVFTISHRAINSNRELTFHHLATIARTTINMMLRHDLFDRRNVNDLTYAKKFEGLIRQIVTTFRTKTRSMFNNLVRIFCHLQCFSFMTGLPSHFTIAFLTKTAGSRGPVFIFRRWYRAIVAVFSGRVLFDFSLKINDSGFQQFDFLRLHLYEALQFTDNYLLRSLHNLYCKTNPEIHYFKERNRLFINAYKPFFVNICWI